MANPTKKSEGVEDALKTLIGQDRRIAIQQNVCQPAPIGCGGPAIEFKDGLSKREYEISGLCQKCQDKIFGD